MTIIEKTEKYAILSGCVTTDDEVVEMGGTAFLTGSFGCTPELEEIHKVRCEVLADYGLDTTEDVVIIFAQDWAKEIESEIRLKLKEA